VQAGAGGFTVQVTRTVDKISGSNNTQTIRTVYTPQDRIIEVGTKPRPRTDDDDEDEDEDEDEDDDD
jgi:hypothetical protein